MASKYFNIFLVLVLFVPSFSFASDSCASQLTSDNTMRFAFNNSSEYLGATRFIPSVDCAVDTISVNVAKIGTPVGALTVEVWDELAGVPFGVLEVCSAITPGAGYTDLVSTCSGAVTLTASTNYWIVLDFAGTPDGANYYRWSAIDANVGGKLKRGPTTWSDWDNAGAAAVYEVIGNGEEEEEATSTATTTGSVGCEVPVSATSTCITYQDWLQINLWILFCVSFLPIGFFFSLFKGSKFSREVDLKE